MNLQVDGLAAAYGRSQVLFGVSFEVRAGEVVTLLGRNGMGKTTTVRSVMGMVRAHAGTIRFGDRQMRGLPSYRVAQSGIGLVPEGRQVFPNLTVRENLEMGAFQRSDKRGVQDDMDRVFELFPRLAERRSQKAGTLSGGEQQMLAIGRALMTNPRLLILDEATEGLAPLVCIEIYRAIESLRTSGLAILIIDKDLRALTRIADRHYVIEKGRVVWTGASSDLAGNRDMQHRFLGV